MTTSAGLPVIILSIYYFSSHTFLAILRHGLKLLHLLARTLFFFNIFFLLLTSGKRFMLKFKSKGPQLNNYLHLIYFNDFIFACVPKEVYQFIL